MVHYRDKLRTGTNFGLFQIWAKDIWAKFTIKSDIWAKDVWVNFRFLLFIFLAFFQKFEKHFCGPNVFALNVIFIVNLAKTSLAQISYSQRYNGLKADVHHCSKFFQSDARATETLKIESPDQPGWSLSIYNLFERLSWQMALFSLWWTMPSTDQL